MKRALIFGGGVYGSEFPEICPADFIIAADKGCEILKKRGIEPHVTVGDFDSSSFIPVKNVVVLPEEKDITDSHAAVNIAILNGCNKIYIYGGMGGRPDHTFANYSLLASLSKKCISAYLIGEGYTVTAVTDGKTEIYGKEGSTVSVFSWSDKSFGVTVKNLKYPLEEATLYRDFALGISNSLNLENAEISVKKGTLIIMHQN